jgi:pentatricopeptide repeat protein
VKSFVFGRDVPLGAMRTYEAMAKLWNERDGKRERKKDADFGNQIDEPLLPIDTARSPTDWLHAVLGVVRQFENIHQNMRGKLNLNNEQYIQHLHDKLQINRTIQGLSGNESVKIIRNSKIYVAMVNSYRKAGEFEECIDLFNWMHEHVGGGRGSTAEQWKNKAREFGKKMKRSFGAWVSGSRYLHAVVNHVWRWMKEIEALAAAGGLGGGERSGGLLPFTTQGLEGVNKKLKHDKKLLSAAQPLRGRGKEEQVVAQLKQLQQVVERHNNEASELSRLNQPTVKQQLCSLCFIAGHNRRTCLLKLKS